MVDPPAAALLIMPVIKRPDDVAKFLADSFVDLGIVRPSNFAKATDQNSSSAVSRATKASIAASLGGAR